uniref:FH2 domain-containing protein n=1 Tax=Macrostomum lignano TaxID=282301 RepID=A0A1I8JRS7_9PLAT
RRRCAGARCVVNGDSEGGEGGEWRSGAEAAALGSKAKSDEAAKAGMLKAKLLEFEQLQSARKKAEEEEQRRRQEEEERRRREEEDRKKMEEEERRRRLEEEGRAETSRRSAEGARMKKDGCGRKRSADGAKKRRSDEGALEEDERRRRQEEEETTTAPGRRGRGATLERRGGGETKETVAASNDSRADDGSHAVVMATEPTTGAEAQTKRISENSPMRRRPRGDGESEKRKRPELEGMVPNLLIEEATSIDPQEEMRRDRKWCRQKLRYTAALSLKRDLASSEQLLSRAAADFATGIAPRLSDGPGRTASAGRQPAGAENARNMRNQNIFIRTTSMDTNVARKKSKEQLLRRLLKQGAVPSIFPNAPSYLSSEKKPQRSTAATSSERLERELSALQSSIDTFQEADSIADCSLHDVRSRLDQEESKPAGFQFSLCDGKLCIYMLEMEPNFHVACYICLAEDLTVTFGFRGLPLKMNRFVDLLTNGKVSTLSQLVNIMSRIKILKEDTAESDDKVSHLLDMAEDLLEEVEELADNRTVSFALEQLKLSRKPASARRYSQELLVFAYLIYSISAAAYKTMLEQEALCLPSDRTLRSITARVGS